MAAYHSLIPAETDLPVVHKTLLASVGPRPIAFAATLDEQGQPNLAPFSYFNVFSVRPPIAIYAPNRAGRTGQDKDTALNAEATMECVINVVTYDIVEQMNLASSPYPPGVNEFEKAGFTALPSDIVQPPRVAESPIQLECTILEVKRLAQQGGAGNLVICEIQKIHIQADVIGDDGYPDPRLTDLVGRMGGSWYARASGDALFQVERLSAQANIGFDGLPASIKHSPVLSGNELAKLAAVPALPTAEAIEAFAGKEAKPWLAACQTAEQAHGYARELLTARPAEEVLKFLMAFDQRLAADT
jgi:flavin reductase (DIM6/NTAB) family NADH-FMN oxidoreductase RutF